MARQRTWGHNARSDGTDAFTIEHVLSRLSAILAPALADAYAETTLGQTLEQLDSKDWGIPDGESHLVTTIHRLRKKSLDEFSVEDLRIVLLQQIYPEHLVPKALEVLEREPLAEGNHYPGDLFMSVAEQLPRFWSDHPELAVRAAAVANSVAQCIRLQWSQRCAEARQRYGASLTEEDVSQKGERDFVAKAEQYAMTLQQAARDAGGP
jgi:hypothetical protein